MKSIETCLKEDISKNRPIGRYGLSVKIKSNSRDNLDSKMTVL
jgi:hypothetical protein